MRKTLFTVAAALLALSPVAALSGGYGPGAFGQGGGAVAMVEVPCYPKDRFKLCPVPAVNGHYPGYLPRDVPSRTSLATSGTNRFAIWVTPNVVPYELAVRDAAAAAAAHCGQRGAKKIVARIDARERYAPEQLDAWKFGGTCQ